MLFLYYIYHCPTATVARLIPELDLGGLRGVEARALQPRRRQRLCRQLLIHVGGQVQEETALVVLTRGSDQEKTGWAGSQDIQLIYVNIYLYVYIYLFIYIIHQTIAYSKNQQT